MKVVVLSAAELTVWLRRNAALISQLAQSERLMASQPTVAFGRDFICQFLERDAVSFDEGDLDSQRTISAAARDLVVGPLANRRLYRSDQSTHHETHVKSAQISDELATSEIGARLSNVLVAVSEEAFQARDLVRINDLL